MSIFESEDCAGEEHPSDYKFNPEKDGETFIPDDY